MLLAADFEMSNAALGAVFALVGGVWIWALRAVQDRSRSYHQIAQNYQRENNSLRRQNRELFEKLMDARRELEELRGRPPGGSTGTEAGGTGPT